MENELTFLWKTLLLNHPHDSICGCSVDSVHRENENRFEQIDQLSSAMVRDAHQALRQTVQQPGALCLFNLGDTPYTGVVEITGDYSLHNEVPSAPQHAQILSEETLLDESYLTDTNILPLSENLALRRNMLVWAENIPAHGYKNIAAPISAPSDVVVSENRLENDYLHLQVNPDGLMITDKQTGKRYPSIHTLWRQAEQGDSYNAAPVPGQPAQKAVLQAVEIAVSGSLRSSLKLHYRFTDIDMSLENLGFPGCRVFAHWFRNTVHQQHRGSESPGVFSDCRTRHGSDCRRALRPGHPHLRSALPDRRPDARAGSKRITGSGRSHSAVYRFRSADADNRGPHRIRS